MKTLLAGIVLLSAVTAGAVDCIQVRACFNSAEFCAAMLGRLLPDGCSGVGRYAPESSEPRTAKAVRFSSEQAIEVAGLVQRRAERWPRIQFEQQKETGEMLAESLDASLIPYDDKRHYRTADAVTKGAK
jgi:hypothetical protein